MDLSEGACAGCGRELGPPSDWRLLGDGRAFHNGCEPGPEPGPPPERKVQSLSEFVERKARNVMHGKNQPTLDEGTDE